MEHTSVFLHHSPSGPPPLTGDDSDLPHPPNPLIFRPAPRRLPQRGRTSTFIINPFYLTLLNRLSPNQPLPQTISRPLKPTAFLEPIEEDDFHELESDTDLPSADHLHVHLPQKHLPRPHNPSPVSCLAEDVSRTMLRETEVSMQPIPAEESEVRGLTETFPPTPPAEPSSDSMDVDPPAIDNTPSPDSRIPTSQAVDAEPSTSAAPSSTCASERPFPPSLPSSTAEGPVSAPLLSPPPLCSSSIQVDPSPPKRQAMRGSFRPPEQVAPEEAQWRTGKAPGYQGLTQKRQVASSSDNEGEPHDIEASAARVLKRPFKPPTLVRAPAVRLKPSQPAITLTKPRMGPARRLGTTIRAKPFTPPSKALNGGLSNAPSRSSSASSSKRPRSGKGTAMSLNLDLIASLETRLRTIRQAIKYDDPAEDDQVIRSIHLWLDAGRQVADRIFAIIPRPTEDREPPLSSMRWNDWGYDSAPVAERFNEKQLEYLRSAPMDKDGEVLDPEGNRIFGDDGDLRTFIDQAMACSSDYIPAYEPCRVERPEPTPKADNGVWNQGTMLLRLSVDPDLLGWDNEAEDWSEIAME